MGSRKPVDETSPVMRNSLMMRNSLVSTLPRQGHSIIARRFIAGRRRPFFFSSPVETIEVYSIVPTGLQPMPTVCPGDESPGYCRPSLRDEGATNVSPLLRLVSLNLFSVLSYGTLTGVGEPFRGPSTMAWLAST